MNVRSSNDVNWYPAPSEVDSNRGNPCSGRGLGRDSRSVTKPATAPAFRTLESFTFRIGRLLAHYGSQLPAKHIEIQHKLNPVLTEYSFLWLILRTYFLAPFIPALRRPNLRVERLERERAATEVTSLA